MKHMGMMKGEAQRNTPQVDPNSRRLWAKKGGAWRHLLEPGQRVKKGETIGTVSTLTGETIQEVHAPFDGIVSFLRVHYSVNAGDTLLWVTKG